MFTRTNMKISQELLDRAKKNLPKDDFFKLSLNKKTGRFFYDPWIINEEFKGTVWETILNTLPQSIGEARLVMLKPGTGYQSHSDIDDRYHLNILEGNYSYLVNIDSQQMYSVKQDLHWYSMNAGPRHSAINLGKDNRVQLVVRKLLPDIKINNPIKVKITPSSKNLYFRFDFDDIVSPWLNSAIKEEKISNFEFEDNQVSFDASKIGIQEFRRLNLNGFSVNEFR